MPRSIPTHQQEPWQKTACYHALIWVLDSFVPSALRRQTINIIIDSEYCVRLFADDSSNPIATRVLSNRFVVFFLKQGSDMISPSRGSKLASGPETLRTGACHKSRSCDTRNTRQLLFCFQFVFVQTCLAISDCSSLSCSAHPTTCPHADTVGD